MAINIFIIIFTKYNVYLLIYSYDIFLITKTLYKYNNNILGTKLKET
jgi:hypothetical protein